MSTKEYDLIVFGATSFTGKLVVEYLNEKYPDLSWAIAARNQEKIDAVKSELSCDVPSLILDSMNIDDIEKAMKQTKLILTTVGPYQIYGNDILAMCAKHGVDYVDLCGEPGWMYDMQQHLETAKQSGARIVHSCGFDSIPSDLGVFFLQNLAQEKFSKPVKQVKCRVRSMKGEFSGGTAASLRATLSKLKKNPDFFNVLIDPFCLCEGFKGPEQPRDNKPYHDDVTNEWVAPFFMAAINTKNVHRSNQMLNHPYGEDFLYVDDEALAMHWLYTFRLELDAEGDRDITGHWRAPDSNWEVELEGLIMENRGDLSNVAYLVIAPEIDVEVPSGFEMMASGTAPFLNGGGDWKVYRGV